MKKAILFLLLFCFLGHAQAPTPNIYGTRTPALYPYPTNAKKITVNAGLKINSTASGLVPPKMTTIQKLGISSPEVSEIVYDTDLENYYSWNGTSWVVFGNSSSDNLQDVTNRGGSTTVQINAESGIKTNFATGGKFEVNPIESGVEFGSFDFESKGDGDVAPADQSIRLRINAEENFDLIGYKTGLYSARLFFSAAGFDLQSNVLSGTPFSNRLILNEFGLKYNTKRVLTEDDLLGGGSGTVTSVTGVSGETTVSLGTTTPVIGIASAYTDARDAYADAKVVQTVTNGVTATAPSQDAVYDFVKNETKNVNATSAINITTTDVVNVNGDNGINFTSTGDFFFNGNNVITDSNAPTTIFQSDLAASSTFAPTVDAVNTGLGLKVNKTTWVDYSATSTVVGWVSFTNKKISYKIIDDAMIVDFNIEGVSNATTPATFTIPFNASAASFSLSAYILNVGSASSNPGRINSAAGSNVITIQRDGQNTAFTGSGTKRCSGQIYVQL